MKKVISIFLLCALILSCFLGCSTPNAPVDENLPDEEGNLTPDDTTQEEIPDNVVNPMPDDDTDEKDPGNEGDSTPDDTDEKDRDVENSSEAIELRKVFDQIRADAEKNAKLEFWVQDEQEYYECKNSDEYDNCRWAESGFAVKVSCSYEDAVNEEWYQQCSATDTVSLNKAFYDEYGGNISHGEYHNIAFSSGMLFHYSSPDAFDMEAFISDYEAIMDLLKLGYVEWIYISYIYGLPNCYYYE